MIRKRLRKLDKKLAIEEVSSQLFKTIFREEKNIDMNAIQHTTQPMIQSTQYSLKIVSQFKILSTWISKTHTHTLNKSNQFYISKTKLRQFSEHTLTHVKLVMAKSHCICTCIKNSKEYCMLCVKKYRKIA